MSSFGTKKNRIYDNCQFYENRYFSFVNLAAPKAEYWNYYPFIDRIFHIS